MRAVVNTKTPQLKPSSTPDIEIPYYCRHIAPLAGVSELCLLQATVNISGEPEGRESWACQRAILPLEGTLCPSRMWPYCPRCSWEFIRGRVKTPDKGILKALYGIVNQRAIGLYTRRFDDVSHGLSGVRGCLRAPARLPGPRGGQAEGGEAQEVAVVVPGFGQVPPGTVLVGYCH